MHVHIGRNFKVLNEVKIDNYHCQFCNTRTKLNLSIQGGFICMVLIPMAPIKKDYLLTCGNCKKSIKKNSLNHIEKEKVDNAFKKTKYKIPFYHFSGILILFLILGFAIYTGIEVSKEEKIRIRKPEVSDVYRVNINNDGIYTTLKVNKIYNDSVSVFLNDIQVSNYDKVKDIDISRNYNKLRLFSKQELLKMFNENQIYQIDRKISEP